MIKKILCGIMALSVVLSFAGCGTEKSSSSKKETTTVAETTTAAETTAADETESGEAETTQTLDADGMYTSEDNGYTMKLPGSWIVQATAANSETFAPGDSSGNSINVVFSANDSSLQAIDEETIKQLYSTQLGESAVVSNYSDFELNGHNAHRYDIVYTMSGMNVTMTQVMAEADNKMGIFTFTYMDDAMKTSYEDTINSIQFS